ncbi:hypothetical protein D9M68_788480 [compost metagenome]
MVQQDFLHRDLVIPFSGQQLNNFTLWIFVRSAPVRDFYNCFISGFSSFHVFRRDENIKVHIVFIRYQESEILRYFQYAGKFVLSALQHINHLSFRSAAAVCFFNNYFNDISVHCGFHVITTDEDVFIPSLNYYKSHSGFDYFQFTGNFASGQWRFFLFFRYIFRFSLILLRHNYSFYLCIVLRGKGTV